MCKILCEAALVEWFQYGKAEFLKQKNRYDEELKKHDCPVTTLTFSKVLSDWESNAF